MNRRNIAPNIRESGWKWTLVMLYEDAEFGAMDATTTAAEALMRQQAHCVVGIYRPDQWLYFAKDMKRRENPAWKQRRAA